MSGVWLASYVVLWLLVLVLGFLLAGALRQLGLLQLRLGDDPGALITDTGLERGVDAPDFTGVDSESGELVTLSELPAAPRMIVFASPGCARLPGPKSGPTCRRRPGMWKRSRSTSTR